MDIDRAVLMVDDEAIILLALRQEVRSILGPEYRYEIAMSAAEALIVFDGLASQGVRIVLVISDWLMPGMNGDDFLMTVRQSHPEVKTMMISGQTDEDHLGMLRESGALDAFLRKPWNRERLASECRKLMDGSA